MIRFISNLPTLKIGNYYLYDYNTTWLKTALERMRTKAQQPNFPIEEIYQGISTYLEKKCKLKVLPIETLFHRIRKMLHKIECQKLANNLKDLSPPLKISLHQELEKNKYELGFFNRLNQITHFSQYSQYGVENLELTDITQCTKSLNGNKRWTKKCTHLRKEIISYLNEISTETLEEKEDSIHLKIG